jgi:hypothetical protein
MASREDVDIILKALEKVPEKKLLILDLVNRIPIKDGTLDYEEVSKHQLEVNLAIVEAKAYGARTIQAAEVLFRIRGREEV